LINAAKARVTALAAISGGFFIGGTLQNPAAPLIGQLPV
jgi:hypothetical protein